VPVARAVFLCRHEIGSNPLPLILSKGCGLGVLNPGRTIFAFFGVPFSVPLRLFRRPSSIPQPLFGGVMEAMQTGV